MCASVVAIDVQIKIRALSALVKLAERLKTMKHFLNVYSITEGHDGRGELQAFVFLPLR